MALEIFQTGADDYGQHMKVLVCGAAGAGKTLLSSTFPNPFFASAEGGLMSVARRRVRGTNIRNTEELRELRRLLDQPAAVRENLLGGPVDTVVIDTIDEIQKLFIRERLDAKRIESLDQQGWGWLGEQMRLVLRAFRNLEMNVVFTCHLKETTDQSTGQVFFKPALQGSVGDEIAQYMDLALLLKTELATRVVGTGTERYEKRFLQTYKDPQHDWVKDRSGQLPPEVQINFEDDFERMHKAIFGFMSEADAIAERTVVQSLEAIEVATAPEAVEAPSVDSTPDPTPEVALSPGLVDALMGTEVDAKDVVPAEPAPEEPLKADEAPVDEVNPPAGVDPVTGEIAAGYVCADCGTTFDSIDQKELGEIMLRRIVCGSCYREATKKK